MDIDKLYFGYRQFDPNTGELKTLNLFGGYRVKRSVAIYVTRFRDQNDEGLSVHPLFFIFGDTRGRCEYEFVMSPWVGNGKEEKVDIYSMYVEPNSEYLLKLVSQVSKSSAQKWLKDNTARRINIK